MKEDAHDGGKHQDEVEQVPRDREVVVAQADDLDYCFCWWYEMRQICHLALISSENTCCKLHFYKRSGHL